MNTNNFDKLVSTLGRLLLGLVIGWIVVTNFLSLGATIGYAAYKGVPFAVVLAPAAQLLLLVAGLSIVLNRRPRFGVALFALFLVSVTAFMHQYWTLPAGTDRIIEEHFFQANLLLLGLCFMLWPYLPIPQGHDVFSNLQRRIFGGNVLV